MESKSLDEILSESAVTSALLLLPLLSHICTDAASAPNDIIWQSRVIGADTVPPESIYWGGVYIFCGVRVKAGGGTVEPGNGVSPWEQAEYENK